MQRTAASSTLPKSFKYFDELPGGAEVKGTVVDDLHDISRATRWRWIKAGKLPKPNARGRFNVGELRATRAA